MIQIINHQGILYINLIALIRNILIQLAIRSK